MVGRSMKSVPILLLLGVSFPAWGTALSGKVTAPGTPLKVEWVKMDADPKCVELHQNQPVKRDDLVVGGDGGVKNVFVFVKAGLKPEQIPAALHEPKVLDQKGCLYEPKVMGLRVGQPLKIRNSDMTSHNIRGISKDNGAFNVSTPRVMEMPKPVIFSKPEMAVRMKCDMHGWMAAYVHVMEHPFFAVTDEAGRFEIDGLPPGEYTIEARHESPRVGSKSMKVVVKEGTPAVVDFKFTVKPN